MSRAGRAPTESKNLRQVRLDQAEHELGLALVEILAVVPAHADHHPLVDATHLHAVTVPDRGILVLVVTTPRVQAGEETPFLLFLGRRSGAGSGPGR